MVEIVSSTSSTSCGSNVGQVQLAVAKAMRRQNCGGKNNCGTLLLTSSTNTTIVVVVVAIACWAWTGGGGVLATGSCKSCGTGTINHCCDAGQSTSCSNHSHGSGAVIIA